LIVRRFVESEDGPVARDQDRTLDEIGLFEHQRDGFLLRGGQAALFEDRAAPAQILEEVVGIDVLLQERPRWRLLVDVPFLDGNATLGQTTSGVPARRSRGLPVEDGLGHRGHFTGLAASHRRLTLPAARAGLTPPASRPQPVQSSIPHADGERDLPLHPGRVDARR
jgi:hypothetical protein